MEGACSPAARRRLQLQTRRNHLPVSSGWFSPCGVSFGRRSAQRVAAHAIVARSCFGSALQYWLYVDGHLIDLFIYFA